MPWVKVDDGFLTNPKVMRAGLEGRAMYIAGLCYCAGGLTDGFVPLEAISKLAALADVRRPQMAVKTLLDVGLWESVAGGYRVHDYLKYQPSAADVQKERERVAEWRRNRKNAVSNEVANGVHSDDLNGGAYAYETPPRPGPARPLSSEKDDTPVSPPRGGRRRPRRSRVEAGQDIDFDAPGGPR